MKNKAIAVIRHSLAAASAALELLEQPQSSVEVGVQETSVVEAAPETSVVEAAPETSVVEAASTQSVSELLYRELVESKFNLRTEVELMAKFNLTGAQLHSALGDMEEEYVMRTRNSDRAALVGLESRN